MRSIAGNLLIGTLIIGTSGIMGCVGTAGLGQLGGGTPSGTVPFTLSGGLRTFEVVAGEESRAAGTASFDLQGGGVASGSLDINPADVSLTVADTAAGKLGAAFQQIPSELSELCINEPLIITVWVAPVEDLDTVFESDQMYTATVTLNESCQPTAVSVTPDSLMPDTLALIEAGEFAIGISVISPVTGSVVIEQLSFAFRA